MPLAVRRAARRATSWYSVLVSRTPRPAGICQHPLCAIEHPSSRRARSGIQVRVILGQAAMEIADDEIKLDRVGRFREIVIDAER